MRACGRSDKLRRKTSVGYVVKVGMGQLDRRKQCSAREKMPLGEDVSHGDSNAAHACALLRTMVYGICLKRIGMKLE